MPHLKAYLFLSVFAGAAYLGYQRVNNTTTNHLINSQEEKPATSKPWPWEARRQAPEIQYDNAQPKNSDTLDISIPFSHTFPDFYAKFAETPTDDLGQDWDDSNEEASAKYVPEPHDLQTEPSTDLGHNWDD